MEAAETPSVEQRLSTVEGRLTALESGRAGTSSESSRVVLDVGGVCFKTTRTIFLRSIDFAFLCLINTKQKARSTGKQRL